MAGNTFGHVFRLTTFGESHGPAIGGIVEGCPAGLFLEMDFIQHDLNRRKPGQSSLTSPRKEKDEVEFLSGIFDGKTTGAPIGFIIRNVDVKSADYDHLKNTFRPSHADYTYEKKYGLRDYRGGGRSSARETATRVVAGAIAKQLLQPVGIKIQAYVSQIGSIRLQNDYTSYNLSEAENSLVRCPDVETGKKMEALIEKTKITGDTLGGVITCVVQNAPVGLGEPVFDKLDAELAKAMLSINAVKGFDIGSGFQGVQMKGSEHNDPFKSEKGKIFTTSNYSGGVQGGISNGQDIYMNVAFKPVATLMQKQQTIDKDGKLVEMEGKGRHDVCVVPRAVPIVEAMAALVLADLYLRNKVAKFNNDISI
jgi:chorismate synthase